MKRIIFLGLCITCLTFAEENPFSLDENFQKIDKAEAELLSALKNIQRHPVKHIIMPATTTTVSSQKREIVQEIKQDTNVSHHKSAAKVGHDKNTTVLETDKEKVQKSKEEVARIAQKKWIEKQNQKQIQHKKEIALKKKKITQEQEAKAKIKAEKEKIQRAKKLRLERAEAMRIKKLAQEKREAQQKEAQKKKELAQAKAAKEAAAKKKEAARLRKIEEKKRAQKAAQAQKKKEALIKQKDLDHSDVKNVSTKRSQKSEQDDIERAYLEAIKEVDE